MERSRSHSDGGASADRIPAPAIQGASPPLPGVEVGAILGDRYHLEKLLGTGGAGRVFRAHDRLLKESVALKVLRPERAADGDWIRRLAREVKVARVIRHINVCRVYELGFEDGHWFITMEVATGGTLRDTLGEGQLTADAEPSREPGWPQRLADARAICAGLAAIHAVGITHRDLTPQNVLRMDDGRLAISDFGLAIGPQESTTFQGGTPRYMAPEVLAGETADQRSDVWQLGILLHERLFGRRPEWDHHGDRVTLRRPVPEGGSPVVDELMALCAACLSQDRTARPASAVVVAGRLAAAEGATPRGPVARALVRVARMARRPLTRWVAVAAMLAAIAIQTGRLAARARMCRAGAVRVAGVWDAGRRQAAQQAFGASGRSYAADAFTRASDIVDQHLRRWVAAYTDACEATQVRGDQSSEVLDLRIACLNENLDSTSALTQIFAHADETVVAHAVEAATTIGDLDRCADIRQLRLSPPPPKDPMIRKAAEDLRQTLGQANALYGAGQYARASQAADIVIAGAQRIDYRPLMAEALATKAYAAGETAEAKTLLERAVVMAESCGEDRITARAAAQLVGVNARPDPAAGERWAALSAAAIERIGGDLLIESWLVNNLGHLRHLQGHLEESRQAFERAVSLKARALGPDHSDVALSMDNLAAVLVDLGRLDEALDVSARALAIQRRRFGDDHQRVGRALSNRGEILLAKGALDDANKAFARSLKITSAYLPGGLETSDPEMGLGETALARGESKLAMGYFERALEIREKNGATPFEVADSRFQLARAIDWSGGSEIRAARLARQALLAYAGSPYFEKQTREIESWLAARPSGRQPKLRQARRG